MQRKPRPNSQTPKRDRELCVATHLFAEESLTMITKTDRDGWNTFGNQSDVFLF